MAPRVDAGRSKQSELAGVVSGSDYIVAGLTGK